MPINSVTIYGHLTRDPEIRALPSGSSVCELGVAVNERVKNNDQWEDRASFFDVVVYGNSAEATAKYLAKGRPVVISGRLRQERWQNQAGENRSRVRIVAQDVQFTGGRDDQQDSGQPRQETGQGAWGGQQPPVQQAAQGGWGGGAQTATATPAAPVQQQAEWGTPPPAPQTGPADDDIPFRARGHENHRYHAHSPYA